MFIVDDYQEIYNCHIIIATCTPFNLKNSKQNDAHLL